MNCYENDARNSLSLNDDKFRDGGTPASELRYEASSQENIPVENSANFVCCKAKFCTSCGQKLEPNSNFCGNCGEKTILTQRTFN